MKLYFSTLGSAIALLVLQGCSPMGEAISSSENSSVSQVDSTFETASVFGDQPPRSTGPAPAPQPMPAPPLPPPPPGPPGPVADYVCTHGPGTSFCNTKDLSVNIDQLEKYVRASNKSLNRIGTICLPASTTSWKANPNYPISWACTLSASNFGLFSLELPTYGIKIEEQPSIKYHSRVEQPARPANGYRSHRHFNAPFRCYGADATTYVTYVAEDTIFDRRRFKFLCYFNLNQLPAEALADAVAEAREYATYENTNFIVNCTTKIRMIGPQAAQNIPVNVLECSYDNPPPRFSTR